jgi:hypothetical protein
MLQADKKATIFKEKNNIFGIFILKTPNEQSSRRQYPFSR